MYFRHNRLYCRWSVNINQEQLLTTRRGLWLEDSILVTEYRENEYMGWETDSREGLIDDRLTFLILVLESFPLRESENVVNQGMKDNFVSCTKILVSEVGIRLQF